MPVLEARQYGYGYGYGSCYGNNCRSGWYTWGRWVVLGAIILAALAIFFLFSCITARRRRKMGYTPYRGTGWTLGRTPPGHAPATYNGDSNAHYQGAQTSQPYYNNSNNAPPAYEPQPNNSYPMRDVGVQEPAATYGGAYAPPKGPPPGHNDGIVR